jgi:integrase
VGNRTPSLRLHATGQWFTRFGGRDHYFGTDKAKATQLFLDPASHHEGSLRAYLAHKAAKARLHPPRPGTVVTVAQLALRFIDAAKPGTRQASARRTALRRFVLTLGKVPTFRLDEEAIAAFSRSLSDLKIKGRRLAPKTVAHEINTIKQMLRWGRSPAQGRIVPAMDLACIRPPRVRLGEPEDLPLETIRNTIARIDRTHPMLALWLRFGYLTACRASEICRVAHGQGKLKTLPPEGEHPAIPEAFIALHDHKTSDSTQSDRVIPLSPQALIVYRQLAPLPRQRRSSPRPEKRLNSDEIDSVFAWLNELSRHCRSAGVGGWPHRMRDSAATHLLALGVEPATVDLVLGHAPTGELGRYARPSIRVLRAAVSRIVLP